MNLRAADVVTGIAAKLGEPGRPGPSDLPGWTRGHVLVHVCGIAERHGPPARIRRPRSEHRLYDGGLKGAPAPSRWLRPRLAEHRADLDAALDRASVLRPPSTTGWRGPSPTAGSRVRRRSRAVSRSLWYTPSRSRRRSPGRKPQANRSASTSSTSWPPRCPKASAFCCKPLGLPEAAIGSSSQKSDGDERHRRRDMPRGSPTDHANALAACAPQPPQTASTCPSCYPGLPDPHKQLSRRPGCAGFGPHHSEGRWRSRSSRLPLTASPQRKPPRVPSVRITRWQGTNRAAALNAQALAAARTALALPESPHTRCRSRGAPARPCGARPTRGCGRRLILQHRHFHGQGPGYRSRTPPRRRRWNRAR